MNVDVIDTYDAFEKVRRNWDAVYEQDPEAQFFLSWAWLAQIFKRRDSGWCVLAAGSADEYVAFFPLRVRLRLSGSRGAFVGEIDMAGEYSWADYTGFVCHPDHEQQAIPSLAERVKRMNFAKLTMENLSVSDGRLALFTDAFEEGRFVREVTGPRKSDDGTDPAVCPYVDLPDTFERYLAEKVSSNTRQKTRRLLRQMDNSPDLRITHATPDTFDRDLGLLERFWRTKWAETKGERAGSIAAQYCHILRDGLEAGLAHVPVLWRGDTPLGVLGNFVDRQKKALLYFVAGRDLSSDDPPPGLLLHAHSIRWAIENGLTRYDFLRGNEPFKYSLGASDRRIRSIVIRGRPGADLPSQVDPQFAAAVLRKAIRCHEAGVWDEAEIGYRQVLGMLPRHPTALRRLGALLHEGGRYAEARDVCRQYVTQEPSDPAGWRQLGDSLLSLGDRVEVESALARAARLEQAAGASARPAGAAREA